MKIQDFSEALSNQDSSLDQAFNELRRPEVRSAIENPPPGTDAQVWPAWS